MSRYDRIKRREKLEAEERYRIQQALFDKHQREFKRLQAENPGKADADIHWMRQEAEREAWRRDYENNVFGGFAVAFFKTLLIVVGVALWWVLPQASVVEILMALIVFAML